MYQVVVSSDLVRQLCRRIGRFASVALTAFVVLVGVAYPQLAGDPNMNSAVCVGPGDQWSPAIMADGSGGAILTWHDNRGGNYDIYAQKVDVSGKVKWTVEGVAVCPDTQRQGYPELTTDGSGGAIITWCDDRSGNCEVFAQRVNASGSVVWAAGGVAVCKARGGRTAPAIVSDGSGGAIITWHDNRDGNYNIFAQKFDASGNRKWGTSGVGICTATGDQFYPVIVSDNSGGAIVAWDDNRNRSHEIFAQRINSSGDIEWAINGVAVCTGNGGQKTPAMVSDGSGGAIISWHDVRNGNYDIFAQKLDASGKIRWTNNGVAVCAVSGDQSCPTIVADGSGGAIATWYDKRNGNYDIFVQTIDMSGAAQWTVGGVAVCTETGDQMYPTLASDGTGGAIITWHDNRDSSYDVYAERVDASGTVQWTENGIAVCTAEGDQSCPTITADGAGGAIITWSDPRNTQGDIFAQRVDREGNLLTAR